MNTSDAADPLSSTIVARLGDAAVPANSPLLRADDLGVLRGDGVFETTLVVRGVPRDLPEHLSRMQASAQNMDLSIPPSARWAATIGTVIDTWGDSTDMVLRAIATRGPENGSDPTCYVMGSAPGAAITQQRSGVRILLLDRGFHGADVASKRWLLPSTKSLSYAVNVAAGRYARTHDADDAIFCDPHGFVLEGPTSTVVIARGHHLYTPPAEGVLPGITAKRLFIAAERAGWQITTTPLTSGDLFEAVGTYLTSSTRILAPVISIDHQLRENDRGITETLRNLLEVPGINQ